MSAKATTSGARPARERRRVGVLVSGGGRSLENLAAKIGAGELDATIAVVIANTAEALALERSRKLGLATEVVSHKEHSDVESFSRRIFDALERHRCELAVLAGFLRLIVVPKPWVGRVLNIHPSLLPAFGGKGYYGERVHRAVLERGVRFTGCTVHYVTNEYDAGPILVQRCVEVLDGDTVETLAARVFEQEKLALPEAIAMHLDGRARLVEGRVQRVAAR